MQKIFIKYVAVIMTAAIFLILFINGLFNSHTMRNQQFKTFQAKIDQMIHTLENNRMELALLNENLDADYLTRACGGLRDGPSGGCADGCVQDAVSSRSAQCG